MFSDMDDMYFTNPSEADSIIDEATDRLRDLIKDDVKCAIDAYNKAIREKDNLESNIARLNWEKQRIEDDIEAAKRDAENAKTVQIPEIYVNNFVKKYTGFYAPGDEVYIVAYSYKNETCPVCEGTGKVKVSVGSKHDTFTCPNCNGYEYVQHVYYFVDKDTVESVDLKLCFHKNHANACHSYYHAFEPEHVYLKKHTACISLDCIFRTEAEAQAKADELNKKEAEKANG